MSTGMLSMLLQSLLGLALVLGLFALLVWAARRLNLHNGGPIQSNFKIIQRMHLDSKNSIVEIRHKNEHYLLGLSPGGMVQLHSDQVIDYRQLDKEPFDEIPFNKTQSDQTQLDKTQTDHA